MRKLSFVDIKGIYLQFFVDEPTYLERTNTAFVPSLWSNICTHTKEALLHNKLLYEDATPYLYVKELIEGVRMNKDIRYVFVDEGQDYSAFQYEYIKKLFPRARMTVLGDFGQAIFMQSTSLDSSNSQLVNLYGESETTLIRLLRSYRSTKEIVEFTKSMLPEGDSIIPFDRRGPKPLLKRFEDGENRVQLMVSDIELLKAEGLGSIAIITKTAAESRAAYESLKFQGVEPLHLVTKETEGFDQGIKVIPVYLAKGVEFDAVLVYDASSESYREENERKLLYTACTRAMHRLHLYSIGEWSPFVQALPEKLYEKGSY